MIERCPCTAMGSYCFEIVRRVMVIQEIGIIGSGAMGGGIAQLAAQNGFSVVLEDRKDSDLIIEAVTENDYEISRGCARRKVGKKERRGIL